MHELTQTGWVDGRMDWLLMCVFVCVWVAVEVYSWSWIASVFTRPLNKAFLSVFLVFGIWDFGMVVIFFCLFFFFLSLCIPPPPSPRVNFWFKLILPTPLPSDPQLFEIIKKGKRKHSPPFHLLSLPPFLCHIVKLYFVIFGLCTPTCISAVSSISLLKSHWFVLLQRERVERRHVDITCYWQKGPTLPPLHLFG